MNVVVLIGTVSREPEVRDLPSGSQVLSFDLATSTPEGRTEAVPVCLVDPPASFAAFAPGVELVVAGRVRRRFYRAGGSTQSRTEVVADQVVPLRQRKRSRAVLERARSCVEGELVGTA